MKTIKIIHNGIERELQYKIESDCGEGTETYYWTNFYEGTEIKRRKQYLFFGKVITTEEPKRIFKLNFNVETKHQTKKEISAILHRQLELAERESEIAKGELI